VNRTVQSYVSRSTDLAFVLGLVALPAVLLADKVPDSLELSDFRGPEVTPCPACLAVAPTGEVLVGVNLLGSLGKGPGKGKIVRLVDSNQDGEADEHSGFALVDHPRGLISVGDKLYVFAHDLRGRWVGDWDGLVGVADANDDGKADGPAKNLVSGIW